MTTSLARALLCLAIALVFSGGNVLAGPILAGHVDTSTGSAVWMYNVFNDQSLGDSIFISSFTLEVASPVFGITSPDGWTFSTDNASFVQWFNTDPALPYPNDIAPGTSRGGFSVTSTATSSQLLSYGLSGWDHTADQPGPSVAGIVLAPSVVTAIPEPSSASMLSGALLWALVRHCVRR